MKNVLWLASWYPNESDPFSGDFIKRQAEAVSVYQPIKLIFVGKQNTGSFPERIAKSNLGKKTDRLQEYILNYPSEGIASGFQSKWQSLVAYFKLHLTIIRQFKKNRELPDLVHVQVAMKAGLIALYLKRKYKIPYVLTEHWSGYYPQSRDSLFKKSFIEQYFTRKILKNASGFFPVSEALGKQVSDNWLEIPFQKIPNVVDTRLFFPSVNSEEKKFRFIHISTLVYPKNPEAIIRSFNELIKQGFQSELVLVGPMNDNLKNFIKSSVEARDKIHWTGEISYGEVAIELQKSSALLMFSIYENMPCVILEALCTGLPVIASRVGGIPEVIQKENGMLVESENEIQLLEAMKSMMQQYHLYDQVSISKQAAAQYSYEAVGKIIVRLYEEILNTK